MPFQLADGKMNVKFKILYLNMSNYLKTNWVINHLSTCRYYINMKVKVKILYLNRKVLH